VWLSNPNPTSFTGNSPATGIWALTITFAGVGAKEVIQINENPT